MRILPSRHFCSLHPRLVLIPFFLSGRTSRGASSSPGSKLRQTLGLDTVPWGVCCVWRQNPRSEVCRSPLQPPFYINSSHLTLSSRHCTSQFFRLPQPLSHFPTRPLLFLSLSPSSRVISLYLSLHTPSLLPPPPSPLPCGPSRPTPIRLPYNYSHLQVLQEPGQLTKQLASAEIVPLRFSCLQYFIFSSQITYI